MSSGSYDDGPCKICGIYTSNIEFKHRQLCRACANKIDNWSKEDILKYQHDKIKNMVDKITCR